MQKKILKIFKDLIFKKHKYTQNSKEVKVLKKICALKKINSSSTYFSMPYNDYYKDLIYELKYKKCIYVAKIIANLIKKDIDLLFTLEKIDNILITPISQKRLRERGFNQVAEILNNLELSYLEIQKTKDTLKMSKLYFNHEKRLNILNTFNVKGLNLDNKSVLIFDDIITSGATVNEIKKQLKKEYKNIKINIYGIAISNQYIRKGDKKWNKN